MATTPQHGHHARQRATGPGSR